MRKYMNKRSLLVCIILSAFSGLMIPFNTWAYSQIFALVSQKRVVVVIETIGFIIFGMIALSTIDWLYQRYLNKNIADFNQNVRVGLIQSNFIETNEEGVSDRTSFLNNDLDLIENNYIRQAFTLVQSVSTVLFTLVVALRGSVVLTIIFVLFGSVTPFIPKIFKSKIEKKSQSWSSAMGSYVTFMTDLMRNINSVLSYNALSFFLKRGQGVIANGVENRRQRDNVIANSNFAAEALAYTMTYIPIGIGIVMVIKGNVSLAGFVAVQYSSSWIINVFLGIARANSMMNAARPSIAKITSFQPLDPNLFTSAGSTRTSIPFAALTMDEVDFSYHPENSPSILRDVSFQINSGEKVLLTGPSGAGKSTFINILIGQIKPRKGTVQLKETQGDTVAPLPDMFGVVRQSSSIFTDSIRMNLTLGREFTDEQILIALKKAGLSEFVRVNGIDYMVAENGTNLSGGEQKRIELARAFLYNKTFLVIDEGTASLDPKTADEIHMILLNSPLTILEIDHHIDPKMQRLFNRHLNLSDGTIRDVTEG